MDIGTNHSGQGGKYDVFALFNGPIAPRRELYEGRLREIRRSKSRIIFEYWTYRHRALINTDRTKSILWLSRQLQDLSSTLKGALTVSKLSRLQVGSKLVPLYKVYFPKVINTNWLCPHWQPEARSNVDEMAGMLLGSVSKLSVKGSRQTAPSLSSRLSQFHVRPGYYDHAGCCFRHMPPKVRPEHPIMCLMSVQHWWPKLRFLRVLAA